MPNGRTRRRPGEFTWPGSELLRGLLLCGSFVRFLSKKRSPVRVSFCRMPGGLLHEGPAKPCFAAYVQGSSESVSLQVGHWETPTHKDRT